LTETLIGEKVILKPTTLEDLDFICEFETDKSLWVYEDYVKENNEETRELYINRMKEDVKVYDFIITAKDDEKHTPLGMAYIWSYNDYRKSWELGYAVLPEYQKQGYALDSARLLLKLGFEKLKAHKIVGMCNSENVGSAKIMERIGMRREGVFKEELFCNGKWIDQCFYSILEEEYQVKEK